MARRKEPSRFVRQVLEHLEYAQMTPEERLERENQRIQAAMKSLETRQRNALLKFLETPEQKRQREEAKRQREEAKRRRALAKIGLTPEEFDARVREFERKFFRDQE